MRTYRFSRDVTAGCFVCHGGEAKWDSKNAQALAARHCDATGHETWCQVYMSIKYVQQKTPTAPKGLAARQRSSGR